MNTPIFGYRLPPTLKAQLQAMAEAQGRSLTNMITFILTQYIKEQTK